MENKKTNSIKKKLGIVAVMLVLVLAIGATAGTTLARYISSATVESQVATVAKFGYTFTADTSKMFGTAYGNADTDSRTWVNQGDLVLSSSAKNLVAPSATGYMTLKLQGSAEVSSELVLDFSKGSFETVSLTGGIVDGTYYPIKWASKVGNDVSALAVDEYDNDDVADATDLASIVAAAIEDAGYTVVLDDDKVYVRIPANTDLTVKGSVITIGWMWDFHVDDTTDIYDSILGYKAYGQLAGDYAFSTDGTVDYTDLGGYTEHLNINLDVTATIMQVLEWHTAD